MLVKYTVSVSPLQAVLKAAGIVDEVGIVKLEVTPDEVHAALEGKVVAELQAELKVRQL